MPRATTTNGPQPAPASFLVKLHRLCETSDPNDMGWHSDEAFYICSLEYRALAVLAQELAFRSFSSFVRQLSYYGFKRLSDRRRSDQKSGKTFVIFTHESGNFLRGDSTKLHLIIRRGRPRRATPKAVTPRTSGSSRRAATGAQEFDDAEWGVEESIHVMDKDDGDWAPPARASRPAKRAVKPSAELNVNAAEVRWPKTNLPLPSLPRYPSSYTPSDFYSSHEPSYYGSAAPYSLFSSEYDHGFPVLSSPSHHHQTVTSGTNSKAHSVYYGGRPSGTGLTTGSYHEVDFAAPSPAESTGASSDSSAFSSSTQQHHRTHSRNLSDPALFSPPPLPSRTVTFHHSPELHPRPAPVATSYQHYHLYSFGEA